MIAFPIPVILDHGAVLVVEDNALIRLSIADALTEAGFTVFEAANAEEALELLSAHATQIRAIFTDVYMPGPMDGLELAWLARRRWPWIAVLVTSGQAQPSCDDLPSGVRFIPKPYAEALVIAALAEAAYS